MADKEDERDEDEREDEEGGGDEGEETSKAAASSQDDADDEGDDEGGDEGDDDEGGEEAAKAETASASASSDGEEDDDEGGDDEGEAAPAAAAPAAPAKKGDRLSAGARLAAAKAAKAAKKAAKKAAVAEERRAASAAPQPNEEDEETPEQAVERQLHESPVGQAALKAQDWLKGNQTLVTGVAAAAALALLGWVGWNAMQSSSAESAAAALQEAVEISQARIVEEGEEDESEDDDERTFPSVAARNEAALDAYRAVVAQHGGTDAAAWAQLGVARLLLDQGEPEDAREAYEAAVAVRGSDPIVALRAYEGIGFTFEAEENWDEARDAFDRIRGIRDGAYGPVADYHLARLSMATGDDVAAQEALEALVDAIRADSESTEPEFPYVLAQAQTLLRQLDPSSSDGSDSLDIEEMIRRMMAERAAGGRE